MNGGRAALVGPRVVLASASPRRRQLLRILGLEHLVDPAGIDEAPAPGEPAGAFARRAAADKAREVAGRHPGAPVLGADTVVEVDGRILGKPADDNEARMMLRALSGREHHVHSGLALAVDDRLTALVDTAAVRFRSLDEGMIDWYVTTGEPRDKAGAYGVQGAGGLLVEAVFGSPHTVVGLPVHRLPELFAAADLDLWKMLTTGLATRG